MHTLLFSCHQSPAGVLQLGGKEHALRWVLGLGGKRADTAEEQPKFVDALAIRHDKG